jgi:hypothetical protein
VARSDDAASEAALHLRVETSVAKVDAGALHRHSFPEQEFALRRAPRQASVGANNSVPRETMVVCEDVADKARRAWIDIAVSAHCSSRYRFHAGDNPSGPRLATIRIGVSRRMRPQRGVFFTCHRSDTPRSALGHWASIASW